MRKVTVSATQMACSDDINENVATAEKLIREAAKDGSNIILIQELFEGLYFCQDELPEHFSRAREMKGHPTISHFQSLAKELGVVLPISFYEKASNAQFRVWIPGKILFFTR